MLDVSECYTETRSSVADVTEIISSNAKRRSELRDFELDQIRAKEVRDALKEASRRAEARRHDVLDLHLAKFQCELIGSRDVNLRRIKEAAESVAVTGLLPEWEERIRELAGESRLRGRYVDILEEQMRETKERYYEAMHHLTIHHIVNVGERLSHDSLDESHPETSPYKYPGRTKFPQRFSRNRLAFVERYHLPHRLMRRIMRKARLILPEVLCDLAKHRGSEYLDPDRLFQRIATDLKRSDRSVTGIYYSDIVRSVSQRRCIQDVLTSDLPRFLKCASSLLALQIINCAIDTVEHSLRVLADSAAIPLLKLELKYENGALFTSPRLEDVYNAFHDYVEELVDFVRRLAPLESWIGIQPQDGIRMLSLPDWYLDEAHRRLVLVLDEQFRPLTNYMDELRQRFSTIYESNAGQEGSPEACIAKVEELNRLIREINGMPDYEYLLIMKLRQVVTKRGLVSHANELRERVISQLVERHWNYNLEICAFFETLRERALNVPRTTRELLDLGQYMLMATSTLIVELQNKIILSLRTMSCLIEMTTLSRHHVELNNTTIHWLKRIKPVFERSSAMYEQMKFELEERLQNEVSVLNARVENMFPRLAVMNDMDDAKRMREYIEDMRKVVRQLERMEKKAEWINSEEALFQFPMSLYPRIKELKDNISPFYALIYRGFQWQRNRGVWLDGPFEYLDVNDIESRVNQYAIDFTKSSKQYKATIKMQLAMNYPYSFTGLVDDADPFQQPAPLKLCYQLLEDVKWFKQYVSLLAIFRNPAMRQLHWDDMSLIAGFDLTPDAGTTLRKIINMDLMGDLERYEIISNGATKELALELSLASMVSDWDNVLFTITPYKDTQVPILTQLDDILTLLEEHIVKIQAMRGSAFVKQIENEVKSFYALLLRMQSAIDEWTKVQMQWIYLLPIFSSKDIVAQLPEEEVLFIQVDATFRSAMRNVTKDPRVRETAGAIGLLESMRDANVLMERINNGVLDYLEKKRLFFPRFFFLSNDDMLEILSETKEPLRVQPHLKKCFEGINRLGFDANLEIYSMLSDDKEEVNMKEVISTAAARGCVERWLVRVEEEMVKSVRQEIYLSYLDYETNERVNWVCAWPGMVILCVSQIYWSLEVQNCLIGRAPLAMESLYGKLQSQVLTLVELVRGPLSKQNRTTLNALITIDVHALDVVRSLVEKRVGNEMDFEWLAQLRYYWEDDVHVRIVYSMIKYAYEYLGNCPRLVITPLTDSPLELDNKRRLRGVGSKARPIPSTETDYPKRLSCLYEYLGERCERCYRTLIGAYSLHLNGAPEGPAGTGKTETTKDLSRAIAVQCVVFNCSDGLDYKNMGKFFKGLASCGAWSCFDEFNRIELEVLSVVAQQILCIVQAVRAALETFVFEGTELRLNPAVYVCITMNPGYAGRSELPDNLKVLFRTVAMMVPDYAMIAEIFLYSSGFGTARVLSTKIVTTYKLCSEQLSSQSHYDYGMRAVKTVLSAAQNLKLKYPTEDESILLLRSLIDVNLPKFLARDLPLFQGIVSDLFPGLVLPSPSYDALLLAVNEVARKRNLETVSVFLLKIIQTFEMMLVRHGFMLVGEPFGGKTTVLRTLADALTLMYERGDENGSITEHFALNPKAITLGQLYGYFDPVSSEWTDGICAHAFRRFSMEDTPDRKWVIFDGPVDAVWIESLNTVLDDNKKLCLTSGEVMRMTDTMSMIFETMDLTHASPATVSRCGMIYVEPGAIGWQPFLASWLKGLNPVWAEGEEESIAELFQWLMEPCLEFIRKECRIMVNVGHIHRAVSTMSIFELLMEDAVEENAETFDRYLSVWFQAAMVQSMVWGAAGTLDSDSRRMFDTFYVGLWKGEGGESTSVPAIVRAEPVSLPMTDEPMHEHYYSYRGKGVWKRFAEAARAEVILETESIARTIVPTVDTVKYQSIAMMHIKHQRCFLLYGETGTGKSLYVKDLLTNQLDEDRYLPNMITFAPRITAAQAQELVLLKLHKRRGNQFGPPIGTRCVVFIDEVNAPAKEVYGAQPAIELIRHFLDHGVCFDAKKPEAIAVVDTMYSCAMGPPGGSRQEIYRRFLRHFNLFSICRFADESVFRIFTNLAFIGLKRNGFTAGVLPIVNEMVNATMRVFESAIQQLRPTPVKPHYLFNLRDLARVINGCALIKKESAEGKPAFVRLWVHEILRIFGDRLIEQPDRRWLFKTIKSTAEAVFKERFDVTFDHLPRYRDEITEESLSDLVFGNFMDVDALPEDRRYEEVASMEEYHRVALSFLEEYNDMHTSKIDIVLFRYALEHLARICRVLAISCGNSLMIGTGGSGRQSLTRLAAAMAGHGLSQPVISGVYGLQEWREDIKKILRTSGGVGKDVVFLLGEEQIKDEAFLDDIDSLLNDGEVPNLFAIEERQEIIEMTRLAAQGGDRSRDVSVLTVLAYFVGRCREKLHIVLCFSPIGQAFRIRLRQHPSLVNCCTIDWFEVWPDEALEQVARRTIADIALAEDIKLESVIACKYFHACARDISARFYELTGKRTYITTASFLDLVRTFAQLTTEKQRDLILARERYVNGLDKLEFAAEQIAQMRITLTDLRPQLESSAKETEETMRQIEKEDVIIERATVLVKRDEDVAKVQAVATRELKMECEADLAEVLPALDEATAALDTLKPADISVVKTMKSPPEVIKLVMAAVCVMMSIPPMKGEDPKTGGRVLDYWTPSKRLLGDIKFLDNLRQYDKDNIPEPVMQEIKRTYITNKNFEPKVVARASSAAEGLCKWVRAMVLYDKVLKVVAPKKAKLAAAERDYENTIAFLKERRQMLAELNAKLDALRENLRETMARKIGLETEVTGCRNKLIRAEKLISGLGGEKDRWTTAVQALKIAFVALPGDVLISCGVIAYLGPFTASFRAESLDKWKIHVASSNIPCSQEYSFVVVLGTEIKINSWNMFGLPRDAFSIENAIIMDNSKRWSLFVDPQGQANKWIRNMERAHELEILKLTDRNYMAVIERAIEYGKPVLIENILEELDAALDPILTRKVYVKPGGIWYIALGEKTIEYNPRFKLYLTTKLRNPHYSPEVFNKVTLISSALTLEALDDQLLGIVVAKERPDLQEKREYLTVQNALNSKALKEAEDSILRVLSVSGAGILEDEEAIQILDSSKILATDIEKKQAAARKTTQQIEQFRQSYRPIAKYSAALYYTITDLPNIDPMYQYSLTWFINLYITSIETANKSNNLERRLEFLQDAFTYNLYQNVCRSLFEKDKVLYSFVLYTTIQLATNEINEDEMSFFMSGAIAIGEPIKNPASDWLPERSWTQISRIGDILPSFADFSRSFQEDLQSWRDYYDLLDPINSPLPLPWERIITPFQKLIVARMIRPDIVPIMVQRFVEQGMGLRYVIPPPFDISKSYGDSSCTTPLVFILSPGSDPMSALVKFAENMNYFERFESISLGQGQGPIAQRMIERGQASGSWVCLQNCHLAASWMPVLEQIYEGLDHTNTLSNFRLWLTSYPSDRFPVTVLQNAVKMTNEPPMGLRNNMTRSYTVEGARETEYIEGDLAKRRTFSRLLYALCFFHAVVQERRNYGPQGWNIRYDFNESDLQISARQLEQLIQNYELVPFEALVYLTGECNYGGRVTDERDRRCLTTILMDFYNTDVITDPNYSFAEGGPEYTVPKRHTYEDYIKQIESIPLNPSPEVFGLHVNAGITRNLQLTANLFDCLTLIRGTAVTGDASKQDEVLLNMKTDIYGKMPELFDIEEAQNRYPIEYMESMNTVLVQELERYNDLLAECRNSLTALEKAVMGMIVMTPTLEELATSMLQARIPPSWTRASAYPSLKPLPGFVDDLSERLNFLQNWLEHGKPSAFWISGFSFSHAFLTAITQNYARKYKIPIDKIDFDFEIMPIYQSDTPPVDGAYVYGPYLAGARWDIHRMLLAESYPKILWDRMPIMWMKPCESVSILARGRYECPLYITSARFGVLKTTGHSSNYVLSLLLDTDRPVSHWIKRGLALLCQLDD